MLQDGVTGVAHRRRVSGLDQDVAPEVEREHAARISSRFVVEKSIRIRLRLHHRDHQRSRRDSLESACAGLSNFSPYTSFTENHLGARELTGGKIAHLDQV